MKNFIFFSSDKKLKFFDLDIRDIRDINKDNININKEDSIYIDYSTFETFNKEDIKPLLTWILKRKYNFKSINNIRDIKDIKEEYEEYKEDNEWYII